MSNASVVATGMVTLKTSGVAARSDTFYVERRADGTVWFRMLAPNVMVPLPSDHWDSVVWDEWAVPAGHHEPWRIERGFGDDPVHAIVDCRGIEVATSRQAELWNHAERIVACVNACKDIPTSALTARY